jgi:hypothetical protein
MTALQTLILAGGTAATFLICVVIVIIAGQCHRIVKGINAAVELLQREDARQQRLTAFIRNHNFDPQ